MLFGVLASADAQITVSHAKPPAIVIQPGASEPERLAARELAHWLGEIVGTRLQPVETTSVPANAIVVGQGATAAKLFPEIDFRGLKPEEAILKSKGTRLLLAGGRPRGTVYAVNRLLHLQGVRWWTPWATTVPKRKSLTINGLNVREAPAFESRSPFWFHAFDRDWARRNNSNAHHARLTEEDGGKVEYEGFVHTFYKLVPPERHFAEHPEWYSLIDGKRKVEGGQLCTTNPELRDFIVDRVRRRLRRNPTARIVSVSQNDWYGACQCPNCRALDEAEGSPAASVLALANYVGEKIEAEFPDVAVDTLAYQYTRKAPKTLKTLKPRPNVIVRLCSIEANFAQPLTHLSNASFAQDIRDWSRLTKRLHVWNYVTSFRHYVLPFPNWYTLGPNERFFAENGVTGLFEQGAYQSHGAAMAEMQAWVQAQLLWNPHQDDRALIREFLTGYYGAAAKPIGRYLDVMANAAKNQPMNIWVGPEAPYLETRTLLSSERLWQGAERSVRGDRDLLWRVRVGHLPVQYALLSRWTGHRAEAKRAGLKWPLPESRRAVADAWRAIATGPGPRGWRPITHLNESGLTPQRWLQRFAVDPQPVNLPARTANPPLPTGLEIPPGMRDAAEVVDVQDDAALLIGEGDLSEMLPDPKASDGIACRMPGTHREWAFQLPVSKLPAKVRSGRWKVYAVVRVEAKGHANPEALAFTAGVYSADATKGLGDVRVPQSKAGTEYRVYHLATTELTSGSYIWVAPPGGESIKAVWVDRLILVRE